MSNPFFKPTESNDFYRDPRKADKGYHYESDVDSSTIAKHHTLGPRRNQASPGNHSHTGTDGSVISGGSVVKGQIWNGASATDVTANSATFVEHASFSILAVPLVANNVYTYTASFNWFKASSVDTKRMTTRITKTTLGGTQIGVDNFHMFPIEANTGSSHTLITSHYWIQDINETVDIIFSFNRSVGTAAEIITVRADAARAVAFVEYSGKLNNDWSYKT